jgi:hypothetical protein
VSNPIDRREFLKKSIAALGAGGGAIANAAMCIRTRAQTEGPYHRIGPQSRSRFDATQSEGKRRGGYCHRIKWGNPGCLLHTARRRFD